MLCIIFGGVKNRLINSNMLSNLQIFLTIASELLYKICHFYERLIISDPGNITFPFFLSSRKLERSVIWLWLFYFLVFKWSETSLDNNYEKEYLLI